MEKKQLTQKEELKQQFIDRLQLECNVSPDEASDKADTLVKIPMKGKVESLNASVAAAILMYETLR